jgi:type III secretion system FlhB-like substrate exporter
MDLNRTPVSLASALRALRVEPGVSPELWTVLAEVFARLDALERDAAPPPP